MVAEDDVTLRTSQNGESEKTREEDDSDSDSNEDGDDDDEVEDDEEEEEDEPASKKTKKSVKPQPRCHWTHDETEKLLDLCYEKHIMDKLDGKCGNLPHMKIFKSICVPLNAAKLGRAPKTAAQCKSKYKKLKKLYFDKLRSSNKSGAGRNKCRYWEGLSKLFSKRPRAESQQWGVDSQNTNIIEDDTSSLDSASGLAVSTSSTTGSTPSSSTSQTNRTQPPKYKSVGSRANPIVNVMNTFMERSVEESKKQNEWFERQLEKQTEAQKEVVQTISNSFQNSIAALVNVFGSPPSTSSSVPQATAQAATPIQPEHSLLSLSNINYASIPVPSQSPSPQSLSTNQLAELSFKTPVKQTPPSPHQSQTTPVRTQTTPVRAQTPPLRAQTPPVRTQTTPNRTQTSFRPRPIFMSPPSMPPPRNPGGSQILRLPNGKMVRLISKNDSQGNSS